MIVLPPAREFADALCHTCCALLPASALGARTAARQVSPACATSNNCDASQHEATGIRQKDNTPAHKQQRCDEAAGDGCGVRVAILDRRSSP